MVKLLKNIIAVILLFFVVEYAMYNLKTSEFFKVTELNIESNNKYLIDDLIRSIEISIYEKNILYIDSKNIEKVIKKDVRINDLSFEKKLPNVINISLEVREPAYYAMENGKIYVFDKKMVKYATINEEETLSLPIILYSNDDVINNNLIEISKKLFNTLIYPYISEIKERNGIYILLLNDGIELYTNAMVEESQYNNVFDVYSTVRNTKNIEYIDARFNDIVVK